MSMKIEMTKEAKLHFETAELLMKGLRLSLEAKPDQYGDIAPEHSAESIKRRCVQIRQEVLQVQKGVSSKW